MTVDQAAGEAVTTAPGWPGGRSFKAANQAMDRLVPADVLVQVNAGRRNRAFEALELINAFTTLERQLASPAGDTLVSRPIRDVQQRSN